MKLSTQIPPPEDYFLNTPLYLHYEINKNNEADMRKIEFFDGTITAFCEICGNSTIFRSNTRNQIHQPLGKGININDYKIPDKNRIIINDFFCSRDSNKISFVSKVYKNEFLKIGQFPSIADLKKNDLKKYSTTLPKPDYNELHRAVGLKSHGIGVGAFVYLRRIFERLVKNTYLESKISIEEGDFDSLPMDKKICKLKDFLPSFLVANRKIYKILSKGIHELQEDECLKAFDDIETSIEIILDDIIAKKEAKEKEKRISNKISKI